jgi:hypothetical protein
MVAQFDQAFDEGGESTRWPPRRREYADAKGFLEGDRRGCIQ